jgi:catalase (peroxidase I)
MNEYVAVVANIKILLSHLPGKQQKNQEALSKYSSYFAPDNGNEDGFRNYTTVEEVQNRELLRSTFNDMLCNPTEIYRRFGKRCSTTNL